MPSANQAIRGRLVPVPTTAGQSFPIGATLVAGGANFSGFSRTAECIELLFFDRVDDARPSRVIPIDPLANRTYHYWHVFVPEVKVGQIYGYRAHGAFAPAKGLRFRPSKLLLDPYGRAVAVPRNHSREAARLEGDNTAIAMKSVITEPHAYDWEGDVPLKRPWSRTIIYELHVRGFTAHPSSGLQEAKRGTYAGLIEKIPYLQQLGITAVELLPVFQFDAQDAPPGRSGGEEVHGSSVTTLTETPIFMALLTRPPSRCSSLHGRLALPKIGCMRGKEA
jgi:glycogen operon protein